MNRLTLSSLLAALAFVPAHAQEQNLAKLPKHLTPVPYAGIRNWHVTQNLGPTGARGWVYGQVIDTQDSREILIKSIEPGTPAEGTLQPYDLILGAAVPPETPASTWKAAPELKPFSADARLSLARAITWAESDTANGELKLLRCRNGETEAVTIKLPVLGTYSDTMPLDCPKSRHIVEDAAEFLAAHMPADGYPAGIGRPHNAGLLLATHNPEYLDHVRRSAMRMSLLHTISDAGHETWRWGNTNTFLCEYYLATGDERVLPTIREYAQVLQAGQCNPGTWGHRAVPDFIPPGYGSLNSSGVICFLSLVLANQCGIHDADKAIEKSIGFYGGYAGRGSIPYGDHPPSYATTSNGKNGAVALAFHLLGADPAAQWFARLCASSNLHNLEGGHSGNYFNQTWSPLGAAISGPENTINFWKRFHSYRDLARRADGSFIAQPLPNKREGDLGTGNYVNKGPLWNTGSFALSYLAGSERLAILGRRDSVFAANPPAELRPALEHFRAKEFDNAAKLATALKSSSNARVVRLATQLEGVTKRNLASIDLTLADIQRNLEDEDLFTVKYQLLAIESLLDPADERLKTFRAVVEDPANEDAIKLGSLYDRAARGVSWDGEKGFAALVPQASNSHSTLKQLAKDPTKPYAKAAAAQLQAHPEASLGAGTALTTLKAGPGHKAAKTHTLTAEFDVKELAAIDDLFLSYQMAKALKVQLNGTLILDITYDRADARPDTLRLKPITKELLKPGRNVLTLEVTPGGQGFEASLKSGDA